MDVDDNLPADRQSRHKLPYGALARVHRCAVPAAEVRAGQCKYDIELAAAGLHGMLERFEGTTKSA